MKEIVLEVCCIRCCDKCKTKVLKAVASLTGIDKVTADAEKGTLTVVGDVDPVSVVAQVRKTGKVVEIISVGPPPKPKPPPQPQPKPQPPPPPPPPPCCSQCPPCCCSKCQLVAVAYPCEDNYPGCSIQ